MGSIEDIQKVLMADLGDGALIKALVSQLRWEYDNAYSDAVSPPGVFLPERNPAFDEISLDRILAQRRRNGMRALASAAEASGVPYEHKRLPCNGQQFVVAQAGRVLMITEPIRDLQAVPQGADYKREMAGSSFAARQLELDLGDGYRSRIDPRDTLLVVVLHGLRGETLSRSDTSLAMMQLAVPNAEYDSWLWRADVLNEDAAYRLGWNEPKSNWKPVQEDRVKPRLKAMHRRKSK